ncbi:6068_t:CDS:1, partial [Gigaspora rosea]
KEIKLEDIKELHNGQVLAVRFYFEGRSYWITNVYAPPDMED